MSAEFDPYARDYARRVNDSISFSGMKVEHFVAGKAEHLRAVFARRRYVKEDRILDVGCGVGQYEALLGPEFRLSGVDASPASLDQARKLSPWADFHAWPPGSRLPFDDQTFACAFAICVVHHVPLDQRRAFIAEVHRVLKVGGLFLVYEHNPWNPLTRWAVERCVFDRDAILLSSGWAAEWLGSAGFAEIETRYLFTLPPVSRALVRLDRLMGWCPLGAQYVTFGEKR